MKKLRLLTSLFSVLALSLAVYFFLSLDAEDVSIENGLNGLFSFILFVTFISVRISLINAEKIENRILLTAFGILIIATLHWFNSLWIETTGVYLLILLLLLVGMSILTQLKGNGKFFRAVRFLFLGTLTYIAVILLLPERAPILFDIAFILLAISSLGILLGSSSKNATN